VRTTGTKETGTGTGTGTAAQRHSGLHREALRGIAPPSAVCHAKSKGMRRQRSVRFVDVQFYSVQSAFTYVLALTKRRLRLPSRRRPPPPPAAWRAEAEGRCHRAAGPPSLQSLHLLNITIGSLMRGERA